MVNERFVIKDNEIIEKEKVLPVSTRTDVIVAGGGMAGIAASIAAARNGAKTMLVENLGFLGGTATAGLMSMAYAPFSTISGIAKEIFATLIEGGGAIDDVLLPFDPEKFKHLALDMALKEGVVPLFHTWAADTILTQNSVKGIIIENKSGRSALIGDVVIDATGDGDVAAKAGVPFIKGREKDEKMRPISLLFRLGGIDVNKVLQYVRENPSDFTPDPFKNVLLPERDFYRLVGFFRLVEKAKQKGEINPGIHYVRVECLSGRTSMGIINTTRVYGRDGTNAFDVTKGELEARNQMMELIAVFQKYFPGFEKSFLVDSASMLGVRETRHVIGDYVLREDDIAQKKKFERVVARSATRITPGGDVHSPDGTEGSIRDKRHRGFIDELHWVNIPYDSLLPKRVEQLLIAGRCISADHGADGWTRIQTCCLATGQAAGVAAAFSLKEGIPPRKIDVSKLQRLLTAQKVDLGQ